VQQKLHEHFLYKEQVRALFPFEKSLVLRPEKASRCFQTIRIAPLLGIRELLGTNVSLIRRKSLLVIDGAELELADYSATILSLK
jgi:hypothetical protein